MIQAEIQNSKRIHGCPEHYFLSTAWQAEAKANDPNTWGKNALVLDAWMPLFAPAEHALKRYHDVFKVDSTLGESLKLSLSDVYSETTSHLRENLL
jgi:hypothetical protein